RGIIGGRRVEIPQVTVSQSALVVILRVVRVFLNRDRKIGDRLVPLLQTDISKSAELVDEPLIALYLERFVQIVDPGGVLNLSDLSLCAFDVASRTLRRELDHLRKIRDRGVESLGGRSAIVRRSRCSPGCAVGRSAIAMGFRIIRRSLDL